MNENSRGEGNGIIERRRQAIAGLLIRKPKATQREIHEWIGRNIVNPETNAPYCLGTINNDLRAIREGWEERAELDYGQWVAEELARIDEVETEAWKRQDLELVLKCSDRRRKLLGLDKPSRIDLTTEGQGLTITRVEVLRSELTDNGESV